MSKFWKKISSLGLIVLISVGASYGTYNYLNKKNVNYALYDSSSYGKNFDQKNVNLASITKDGYPDFTLAAENSVHAVVHIKSTVSPTQAENSSPQVIDPFEYFFGFGDKGGRRQSQPVVGYGSGVIISEDGYIITNNHVIDKATELEVTLNNNKKYTATVIGTDPITDIALIKISGDHFPYIPFGNSDNLKVGEWVLAIGNPFDLTSTVTAGIVSAKGRGGIGRGSNGDMTIQSFIQTDAAINPGNSGGALVNTSGQLIGINTAIYSQTGNFAGYGFAVPISIASKVAADIKEFGVVQRAVLGVLIQDLLTAEETYPEKVKNIDTKEGIYVDSFTDRSPAKEAGMQSGDVIIAINNTKIKTVGELQDQVNRYRPGDKVEITILRNNKKLQLPVFLKNASGDTSTDSKPNIISVIGASFKDLSQEQMRKYGVTYGAEVSAIDDNGKFEAEGVAKGFIILKINNQTVRSAQEAKNMIESIYKGNDKGLFLSGFYPGGKIRYYAIDLSE